MSDLSTEGWTDEELAELAAAEAAEAGTVDAADIDTAGTGTATVEAEGEVEHKRATPTYGVLATADAFPEQEKAKRGGGGPSKKLMKLLQVLVDDEKLHGKAVKVIEFTTSNGAKSAIDDVIEGKRQIPDGVWVLKALRTNDMYALGDATVDLIVTSPPYSDAHAVEYLAPLVDGFHLVGQCRIAGGGRSPVRPDRQERLGDEHRRLAPRPLATDERNRPLPDGLRDGLVALSETGTSFRDCHHRLTGNDGRDRELPTAEPSVDLAQGQGVAGLLRLDPKVRQQHLDRTAGGGRMDEPSVERSPSGCARVLHPPRPAERVVHEVDGLRSDLLEHDPGLVVRGPLAGLLLLDVDAPVGVDDAGQVGEGFGTFGHTLECTK